MSRTLPSLWLRAAGAALLLALSARAAFPQGSLLEPAPSAGSLPVLTLPSAPDATTIAPMSGPVDPAEYVVGPGDLLHLSITGGIARSWEVRVSPEGTLFVQNVGSISVTGLTLIETRRAVQQRVMTTYHGVSVELHLLRPRTLLVYLAGEAVRPGPIEVSAASRASEVLTEPLLGPNASRRNIELRRRTPRGEWRMAVDLTRHRLTGDVVHDPLMREGDVLFVPVVTARVGIDGAMGRAGRYELAPGDSLSTLLGMAGGPLAEAADKATLVRFRDATRTDSIGFTLSEVQAGFFDMALQDGDRVFIYYEPGFHELDGASILGEVLRPGTYPLNPGFTRLSDLVQAAGGFLSTADRGALRVFRASSRAGVADPELERLSQLSRNEMTASEYEVLRARMTARREDYRVDWNSLRMNPDLDVVLRAGDVVRVDQTLSSVRIEGEVRRPGLVRYVAGRSVEDYVKLVGGYSRRASRGQMRITRAVTGQTILARELQSLEPGDLVWVPERPESTAFKNLQTFLLLAAQIATVIVAVRR